MATLVAPTPAVTEVSIEATGELAPSIVNNKHHRQDDIDWEKEAAVDLIAAVTKVAAHAPWMHEADKFLRPVVAARLEAEKDPDYQKPNDMLEWIIDSQTRFGQRDHKELARYQLAIGFAAIHSTTLATTNIIYTLAAYPELIPVLREDIQKALAESNGSFTNTSMQKITKFDSFLKETMRCYNILNYASFQRKVLKPFTLSNGQTIPAGSVIETPLIGINNDEEYFPEPEKFDPWRFYKLAGAKVKPGSKQADTVSNAQFVSAGPTSQLWGYGRRACPGRFFAVHEIKIIIGTLILKYDIMNVGGSKERIKNLEIGSVTSPDPTAKILLKKL
ncbi:cytochrome P450 [Colletotrichum truncatum]|uniref:Cytochrome P450 n=1 Tax=Colletotrichum truncatum TaxID=5467 RepID=A0ACC3ZHE5_COLTU|nr:cytochrome P450 [Colletotrichum truncatum]KAF6782287.1 cytochrome P450 [Colletotrichum truncatum]